MNANWQVVAAKEFADARRSRLVWGLIALVAVTTGLTALLPLVVPEFGGSVLTGIGAASEFAAILVPIVALVAAYLAVAGERESGSARLLLGLEPDRSTVVFGKFVGRSAVVVVGVAVGFGLGGVAVGLAYGELPLVPFGTVLGLTAALGVAFVGIAVGISAASATRARAMTLGVAVYLALALLWDLVPQVAYLLVFGTPPQGTVPAWFLLLQGLSPSGAYTTLVTVALSAGDPSIPGIAAMTGGVTPVYLRWWTFAGVLLLWTVLPLLGGYVAFQRADLN